jgi:hypothetical protein
MRRGVADGSGAGGLPGLAILARSRWDLTKLETHTMGVVRSGTSAIPETLHGQTNLPTSLKGAT